MGKAWVFIDEFGNIDFGRNGSEYFGLAAVTTEHPRELSRQLDVLRHELWTEEHLHGGYFHAQWDCWLVRRRVFELFPELPISRVDTIAVVKQNVHPHLRRSPQLYRLTAWQLFQRLIPKLGDLESTTLVGADWRPMIADVTRIMRDALVEAGVGIIRDTDLASLLTLLQAPASAHAGLQLADYAAWACQRRYVYGSIPVGTRYFALGAGGITACCSEKMCPVEPGGYGKLDHYWPSGAYLWTGRYSPLLYRIRLRLPTFS